MKLKKLLNVMVMSQPIKFVSTNGRVTKRTPVVSLDDKFSRPLIESLEEFKVHSIRHVHNDFEKPDYQDYIEITLIGGNDND
jgi:hypothetical protein